MDFRKNPRFSWHCLFLLITTAQEVQGDVSDGNLQGASTQAVTSGSDFEIHTAVTAVNECIDIDCEINVQDDPSAQRTESYTDQPVKSKKT